MGNDGKPRFSGSRWGFKGVEDIDAARKSSSGSKANA